MSSLSTGPTALRRLTGWMKSACMTGFRNIRSANCGRRTSSGEDPTDEEPLPDGRRPDGRGIRPGATATSLGRLQRFLVAASLHRPSRPTTWTRSPGWHVQYVSACPGRHAALVEGEPVPGCTILDDGGFVPFAA